jgi:hypothetical protein
MVGDRPFEKGETLGYDMTNGVEKVTQLYRAQATLYGSAPEYDEDFIGIGEEAVACVGVY